MSEDKFRAAMWRSLPGYPWLPCPICHFNGSCDHTVLERARASGINFHTPASDDRRRALNPAAKP